MGLPLKLQLVQTVGASSYGSLSICSCNTTIVLGALDTSGFSDIIQGAGVAYKALHSIEIGDSKDYLSNFSNDLQLYFCFQIKWAKCLYTYETLDGEE